MATAPTAEPASRGAMAPEPYRVVSRAPETADTWTLLLEPLGAPTSAAPEPGGELVHTIRVVGPVTRALCATEPGDVIGVRGPFGTAWPLEQARGGDLVIVAGGIGLAPVRPAVYHALAHRDDYVSFCLLVGARTPDDLLYVRELEDWRGRFDVEVGVTVDSAVGDWHGRVGVVPRLIMMTFTAKALLERGVPKERIHVSMERNMRCGLGHCGHCQLGPVLICRDGPVFRYDEMEALMGVREL
jgi:NAD(P)H-flavin reductase